VIRGGHTAAAIVALCVVGVAGCTSATPSPTAVLVETPMASPEPQSGSPSPTATPGLGAEIEVGRLDPELTDSIFEFASDGESVLFSSGIADDAGRGASPDLWRYRVHADGQPEVLWRNPNRDHAIVKIARDLGTVAFVDIPRNGERAWKLWLIPRHEDDAILLDSHPGDPDVSAFVPSFSIQESTIVWTAFDRGDRGAVSQLLWARAPDWEPAVLLERDAAEAELWFPSLSGVRVAFCEVVYSADRTSDARTVYVLELGVPRAKPERLSESDLATMPVLIGETVIWKEADPGFSMFNWGKLWESEIDGPGPHRLETAPIEYLNYPSAGSRFVAWWSADAFTFGVYDLLEDRTRVIESYTAASGANVLRPHIAWDLLVWLYVEGEGDDSDAELRYALMPPIRSPP
jgi:hypothetical protein